MKVYRNFREYEAQTEEEKKISEVIKTIRGDKSIFLKEEGGKGWYECQKEYSEDTVKVAYDSAGVIRQFSTDVSAIVPVNLSVGEVSSVPEETDIDGSWIFDGHAVKARTYTVAELTEQMESQRDALLTEAKNMIIVWQTKLATGRSLSDNEKIQLNAWLDYIDQLESVSLTDKNWPVKPDRLTS